MALNLLIQLVKASFQSHTSLPPAGKEAGGVPSAGDQGQRLQGGSGEDQSSTRGSGRDCGSGVDFPVSPRRDWRDGSHHCYHPWHQGPGASECSGNALWKGPCARMLYSLVGLPSGPGTAMNSTS